MKQNRRRRHLRPPCRAQVHQQIERIRSTMQMYQLEGLLEASKPAPSLPRLQFLNYMLGLMQDEPASLESI